MAKTITGGAIPARRLKSSRRPAAFHEPVVARYRDSDVRRDFRADAASANPEVYELLEAEGYKYTIRVPANRILQARIGYLLKRPVNRPPIKVRRCYASFSYQAASWTMPRHVVAKLEWHPGKLYPRVCFIVTNLSRPERGECAITTGGVRPHGE